MVQDSGAPLRPARLRALNTPRTLPVEADDAGRPLALVLRGKRLTVAKIQDEWRIDDEWWRAQPISRKYFSVVLEDGRGLIVFYELVERVWYEQRNG